MKTVCFFGIYNPKYSRNRILINGTKEVGYQIVECQVDPTANHRFLKYINLIKKWQKLLKNNFTQGNKSMPDYVVVAFPGQTCVILAWLLVNFSYLSILLSFKHKTSKSVIIFDCFTSLYDSNVFDRQKNKKTSLLSMKYWFLDFIAIKTANICLTDTQEHLKYLSKEFYTRKNKFICVRVGTDEKIFNINMIGSRSKEDNNYPSKNIPKVKDFIIHFHGNYIPLHGVEYIIDAAKYVSGDKTIKFKLIGNGQTYNLIKEKISTLNLSNITLLDRIPYEDLPKAIEDSDLCLGCFGDTEKAKRVIPNKIYEYSAMGKAIITADTSAIKEIFTNKKDIYLCNSSDGISLGKAILSLKMDTSLKSTIGTNAHLLYEQNFTPKIIAHRMFYDIENKRKSAILKDNESDK